MRELFWIVFAVLCLAIGSPNAHADSYTATFTCIGPCVSLPTAPDVTFPPPPSIMETWGVFVGLIPLGPLDVPTDTYIWTNTVTLDPLFPFSEEIDTAIVDTTNGMGSSATGMLSCEICEHIVNHGSLTFTDITQTVATPEPSSIGLMLLAIALMFAMRKRIGQGARQAS
jgi:PEP-CTERM motif